MNLTRLEVSLFDEKDDFGSWKKKMKVFMSYYNVGIELELGDAKWLVEQKAKVDEIREETFNLISSL